MLFVTVQPGELRVARIEDGRLVELAIQRDDRPSLLGDIYLGRVTAIDRSLDAAFVDIGRDRPGFLPLSEAPRGSLSEGATATLKVVREPSADKGARLTARIHEPPPDLAALAAGAKPPAVLVRGDDPLARLLAAEALPDEIRVDEAATCAGLRARLAEARPDLAAALVHDPGPEPLFERPLLDEGSVEDAIEALLAPRVALPSGGALFIEPTRGLTAIDVDSGGHQASDGPDALALAVDLEAAEEIPRQLRLRALSGLIVVDFLELRAPARRQRLLARLRAALADDPEPWRLGALSRSGLLEMSRRRSRPALHEILTRPGGLDGGGRTKSAATLAYEALRAARRRATAEPAARLILRAPPRVIAALEGPVAPARAALEARLGRPLGLETIAAALAGDYEIVAEDRTPS
jgi:Ribonuclease G/E